MEDMRSSIECPICLDLCNEAIECSKCGNIFCDSCIKKSKSEICSVCRQENRYFVSISVRRIINNYKIKTDPNYVEKLDTINRSLINNADIEVPSGSIHSIEKQRNPLSNKVSRLGKSGKYYCGQKLDGFCGCCNGFCGTTNGCNCSECMMLDIKCRNLPKGWLVNKEGFSARRSQTGIFYCGRKCMTNVARCDGYCGPTNGPNCASCKVLDQQTINQNSRYYNLI